VARADGEQAAPQSFDSCIEPTRISNNFTLTPSATPTQTPCTTGVDDVGSIINGPVRFYTQPSLDPESYLFEIPNGGLPGLSATIAANRSYLWSNNIQPTSLTINTIDLIARVDAIGWVDPNIEWYQVRVNGIYTVFVPNTSLQLTCRPNGLPSPTPDPNMPTSSLSTFPTPSSRVFDGNQSPAVMGACGQHIGASNPCVSNPSGSTIDIVPRNFEFCIDGRGTGQISQCDPRFTSQSASPERIPVYSPVSGCATFASNPQQVIVRLFRAGGSADQAECNTPIQNSDRLVVLTHLSQSPIVAAPNRQAISAGVLVGYLCLNGTEAVSACGVFAPTIPTHLAFQLQTYTGGNYAQVPNDVIGFLARQGCLYDDWSYSQGNPQRQSSPVRACP
jgi:hypothetical protein